MRQSKTLKRRLQTGGRSILHDRYMEKTQRVKWYFALLIILRCASSFLPVFFLFVFSGQEQPIKYKWLSFAELMRSSRSKSIFTQGASWKCAGLKKKRVGTFQNLWRANTVVNVLLNLGSKRHTLVWCDYSLKKNPTPTFQMSKEKITPERALRFYFYFQVVES